MANVKIFGDVDAACRRQVEAIIVLSPFDRATVRIMPDAHSGVNSVVGFTSTVHDKVIPNIVGGDIGCGVLAVKLKKPKKGLDFVKLDKVIRYEIPNGTGQVRKTPYRDFAFEELRCWDVLPNKHVIPQSLGSLGAGNHFIAIDKGESGDLWLVVHTGSRNLGAKIAEHYQEKAGVRRGDGVPETIPYSMCWLEGTDMDDYLHDMDVACDFASANRHAIADIIMKACGWKARDEVESVHNYIDTTQRMIRKGAIDASENESVIIPLNMARGCALGHGLGNAEWNCSAPHGAGRSMTRKEARENISMATYKAAMEGVWSSCIAADTVDESPAAYKDPDEVLRISAPSIEIDEILSEIYNFKAPTKE